MDIFYYVADQLKDVELFDSEHKAKFSNVGSIYNDFDRCPLALLHGNSDEMFCYSQTSNFTDDSNENDIPQILREPLDHAIMAEDLHVGVHYEHLQFETPLFDNYSEVTDKDYVEKVYQLASDNAKWNDLNFTKECIEMYERRSRTHWDDPDTVYDAWLLRKGRERPCFNYHEFHIRYPDFEENQKPEQEDEQSKVEEDEKSVEEDEKIEGDEWKVEEGEGKEEQNAEQKYEDEEQIQPLKRRKRGPGVKWESTQKETVEGTKVKEEQKEEEDAKKEKVDFNLFTKTGKEDIQQVNDDSD